MEKSGPDFYDQPEVFDIYTAHRARAESPNETMEQPLLWEMIGGPAGLDVLDLGCGDARVSRKFKAFGAKSYLGVEGSQRMFGVAQANTEPGFSEVMLSWLEQYTPPQNQFDLVISSLALHYIDDLGAVLKNVKRALRPGGRFIFSVEHPVITSCNRALEESAVRQAWIVDNYFQRGERTVHWMGDSVKKYHRTMEDFLEEIRKAGLSFQTLRESDPPRQNFASEELWLRRQRIPLFLFLESHNS